MPEIDYTGIGLVATISTLLFIALIDTGFAWVVALANHNFDAHYALDFLTSHVLKIGAPIAASALLGAGIPQLGIPPIPMAAGFATVSLAAYAIMTLASIRDTNKDKAVVPPEDK